MRKKRYVIVGVGSRHKMFRDAAAFKYAEHAELVGLCDNNEGRLVLCQTQLTEKGYPKLPIYLEGDFDRMIEETSPDAVIVTTRDSAHHKFIIRAMELGKDAITEKPMTVDEVKCQEIIDAQKRTGRNVRVTFNYRYSPPRTQLKDLLMSGAIGRPISVDFNWILDTRHGADYFRRWHRNKENSGGLMVHKATHHFDLVNWLLSSPPVTVFAMGSREYYTPETAERLGLAGRSERCFGCPVAGKCKFHIDITKPGLKELYHDNEGHDGYLRDRCVFSDKIDIEDTMNLTVRYASGAYLSYSLNAFIPKEGYELRLNGTRGRAEHTTLETSYISGEAGSKVHETIKHGTSTHVFPQHTDPYVVELWTGEGGHGGGDSPLLDSIFLPEPPVDKYRRAASFAEGAYSILTGIAANKSMATGQPVNISDLVRELPEADFTDMPEW